MLKVTIYGEPNPLAGAQMRDNALVKMIVPASSSQLYSTPRSILEPC
jgi:hypothetical protein